MDIKKDKIKVLPQFRQSISDFLYDEEATIPRSRMLLVGSIMVVLATLINIRDVFAGHSSHASHASHESHASHASHSSSSHSSHSNHANHNNATPRPTPVPTPHANHNSYMSTSASYFSMPEAPSDLSSASVNHAATSAIAPEMSVATPVPSMSPSVNHAATSTVVPEIGMNTATPVMQTPQIPPDTPKF